MTAITQPLPVLPGLTHCECSPPRYIRYMTGDWYRIWVGEGGREEHVRVSKHEPDCVGCGMAVAPGKGKA